MPLKLGPWSHDDYKSFVQLGERIGPKKLNAFTRLAINAQYGAGEARRAALLAEASHDFESVEAAWEARRKHPIYKWLSENENFKAAWITFQRRRRKATSEKLAALDAEFVFLRLVVQCARSCFLSKEMADFRFEATAPKRQAAARHVKALLESFGDGVSLADYSKQGQLEGMLRELANELHAQNRKTYEGPRVTGTRALEAFAQKLLVYLDLRSPAIVHDIANMAGISRDASTCERYVKKAVQWRRSLLAEALRHQQKATEK